MNITGLAQYLAIETPIASVTSKLTVPITTYAGLPTEATEGDLLYVSDKQANYIYTGPSGWLEVATGSATGNYLPLSGGTLSGPLTISGSSLSLESGGPIFLGNGNIWLQGNSGGMFYGADCDGINFMAEASKNSGAFLWGIQPAGGGGGNIMGLFSNSNGTCLQLTESPTMGMGLSMIEDTATGISYNCTLSILGSNANMLIQGLGIFLSMCPINVVQGAGPHVLISGNGGANNVQTFISLPNPNPAITGPSVLDAYVLLMEGPQTVNGATTFASAVTITPTTNQLVLGTTDTVTIDSVTPAASRVYTLPNTGANSSFLMSDGAQTINGVNTFTNTVLVQNDINFLNGNGGTGGSTGVFANGDYCTLKGYYGASIDWNSGSGGGSGNLAIFDYFNGFSTTFGTMQHLTCTNTSNQLVLGSGTTATINAVTTATINAVAPAVSQTYTIPDTQGNSNFVMSASNQTLTASITLPHLITTQNLTIGGYLLQAQNSYTTTLSLAYPGLATAYIPAVRAQAYITAGSGAPSLNTSYTNFNISSTIGYSSSIGVYSLSFVNLISSPTGSIPLAQVTVMGGSKAVYGNVNAIVVDTANNATGIGVNIWGSGGVINDTMDFMIQIIC